MGKNCGFFTWALRFQNRFSYKITTLKASKRRKSPTISLLKSQILLKKSKSKKEFDIVNKYFLIFVTVLKFHENYILPEIEKANFNPKDILEIFKKRKEQFKTHYGKFCSQRNRYRMLEIDFKPYFTVSNDYEINFDHESYNF